MAAIEVIREFPVDADTVWGRIGDTANVADWIPAIGSSRQDGDLRQVVFVDGEPARERIVAHDDAARTYTYSYVDGPLPLEHYESTVTVTATSAGASSVTWSAEFGAASAEVEESLAASITEIYSGALDELLGQLTA
ncbi:SRPBCC family protein [Gordonia hydrophobica]|uniref:SRPBCC family protein n=1 Tax=Gordonia hydrophobica TaxID=40516 RepID=A0ABZ2U2Y8_9ACTN|nr:SRPBCC family protein [Gordonia hydrophobica]MBM7369012.1 hypothetical protein [Gordonia hydrophobica]